jgi:hypothetical protein
MKRPKNALNKAASAMGKRSAEVRKAKWGKAEFIERMREYGKRGGRPKKDVAKSSEKGESE